MEVQAHRAAAGLHSLLGLSAARGGRQQAPPFLGVLAAAVSGIRLFWGIFGKLPAEIPPLELPLRWNNGTLEVCGGAGWQGSGRAAKKKRGWVLKTGVFKDCASRGAAGRAGRGAGCEESVRTARASPLQSSRAEPCQKHSSPSPSSGELTG